MTQREIPSLFQLIFFSDVGTMLFAIIYYWQTSPALLSVRSIGIVNNLLGYVVVKIVAYMMIAYLYQQYPRMGMLGASGIIVVYSLFFGTWLYTSLDSIGTVLTIEINESYLPHY